MTVGLLARHVAAQLNRLDWRHDVLMGALFAAAALTCACGTGPTTPSPPTLTVNDDFRQGTHGWSCDAAGYSTFNAPDFYGIVTAYQPLKGGLSNQGSAWLLNGKNSIGLLLYCKKRVSALVANRTYVIDLTVEIATNTPPGCAGTGVPPGEGVLVLGSLARLEPTRYVQGTNVKVTVGHDWPLDTDVLGNIAMAAPGQCSGNSNPWELKTFTRSGISFVASTAGDGWLVAGITKGSIGPNEVYLTKVRADSR